MKILLITYLFDHPEGGGAAKAVQDLARGVLQCGHEVVVLTSCPKGGDVVETVDGVKVYRVFPPNLYWVADKDRHALGGKLVWQLVDTWNPFILPAVRRVVAAERPDLAHVHKLRGLSASVWSALARSGVRRVVQTCHDYEAISPEGTLDSVVGRLALRCHPLLRPYQKLRSLASRHVSVVTAPSHATLSTVTGCGFFGKARRCVVPNSHGIPEKALEALAAARSAGGTAPRGREIRLLFMGRLEKNKGITLLCEVFDRLSPRFPQATLHVAGFGTQEETLRSRYGRHDSITLHGALYGEEKEAAYASCDLVIVPSLWAEVFGIVIVEAFAHGKPVIGTNLGGIPENIEDRGNGWIIPELSCASLERVLAEYTGMSDRQKDEMRERCLASARKYTVEAVIGKYLDIYEELGRS